MKNEEKYIQYAVMIQSKLAELFDENSESDFHIDAKEFSDDKNTTHFFHALANIVPCNMYKKLSGDEVDMLGFNHIANRMCMQYCKKIK